MDFAEILKKNLVIIVAVVVTLLASVWLLLMVTKWNANYEKAKGQLNDLASDEREVRQAKYKLSPANQQAARANGEQADAKVNQLMEELHNTFVAPDYSRETLSPIKLKEQLNSKVGVFGRQLTGRGVQFPTGLTNFTFDEYVAAGYLANPKDIPLIRKHLDVVDELVQRVAASEIRSLDGLSRRGGNRNLNLESSDLYDWCRYNLQVSGDIVQVQKLINSLTNSRMCFIVQQVTVSATRDATNSLAYPNPAAPPGTPTTPEGMMPGPGGMMPGPGGMMPGPGPGGMMPGPGGAMPGTMVQPKPVGNAAQPDGTTGGTSAVSADKQLLPIGQRIAFLELATLKVSIQLDYVEFKRLTIAENK
jgi:hypothetical protein